MSFSKTSNTVALVLRTRSIFIVFEKLTCACFFKIALETTLLPIQIWRRMRKYSLPLRLLRYQIARSICWKTRQLENLGESWLNLWTSFAMIWFMISFVFPLWVINDTRNIKSTQTTKSCNINDTGQPPTKQVWVLRRYLTEGLKLWGTLPFWKTFLNGSSNVDILICTHK